MLSTTVSSDAADLLTSEQVILRLMSDAILQRLALTCVLPAVRYGSEWRFRRQDLDAWIDRIGQGALDSQPSH